MLTVPLPMTGRSPISWTGGEGKVFISSRIRLNSTVFEKEVRSAKVGSRSVALPATPKRAGTA